MLVTNGSMSTSLLVDSSLLLPSLDAKSLFHKRLKTQAVKLSLPWRPFPPPRKVGVRVFQRFSSLERHLSFERCSKTLERQSLLDLAKTQCASRLEEGVGKMPILKSREPLKCEEPVSIIEEGWALKEMKKSYCFNETQKAYLEAKFNIGQTTG